MPVGTILVTGGTGYIGSFTTLALLQNGYDVVIVDNGYNSEQQDEILKRIHLLCGRTPALETVDIRRKADLDAVFAKYPSIDSVIHFAALKAVGESGRIPLEYYDVNVAGTVKLLECMRDNGVTNIVFSSSATVYGDATRFENMIPIPEHCPRDATNTYGRTKAMVEDIITDFITNQRTDRTPSKTSEEAKQKMTEQERALVEKAEQEKAEQERAEKAAIEKNVLKLKSLNGEKVEEPKDQTSKKPEPKPFTDWNAALLRYFNPCGAHPSGIMGEDPSGKPNNLLPILGKAAIRQLEEPPKGETEIEKEARVKRNTIWVFGNEYPKERSPDRTCLRDYIHVMDLALGHIAALKYLRENKPGVKAWNLGSGTGTSVLGMIKAFSRVVYGNDKQLLHYEVAAARPGDVVDLTANPTLANKELNWKTEISIDRACEDLWRWAKNNPEGYAQQPPAEFLEKIKTPSS